jgi:hypothetical protein
VLPKNPQLLPDGSMLGFGLQHVYQVEGGQGLKHVYDLLKRSDAIVYQAIRALWFEPVLYPYYESQRMDSNFVETGLIIRVIQPRAVMR